LFTLSALPDVYLVDLVDMILINKKKYFRSGLVTVMTLSTGIDSSQDWQIQHAVTFLVSLDMTLPFLHLGHFIALENVPSSVGSEHLWQEH
jgi:hypothetical protein